MGDLDRRKHDVDVIERVLGGVRDRLGDDDSTRVIDVPAGERSTVELTVGIADDTPRHQRPDRPPRARTS